MITFSPNEILALLLEVEKNDMPTDSLVSAQHKLTTEYRRICSTDPVLEMFRNEDRQEIRNVTSHQQVLIDGYYALDPSARLLGYFKGQPVIQAHTSPLRMRAESAKRNIVIVTRDGAPKSIPLQGWQDNFIPAEGVSWVDAETAIEDWLVNYQRKLVS